MGRVADWEQLLESFDRVALDTNAVIYFLDQTEPYARLVTALFRACEEGRLTVVIPTLVVAELLVAPMCDGDEAALERMALLLDHFPNVTVAPLSRQAAQLAARIRASHGLATPDALIVGTALESGCAAVIGNDKRWRSRFETPRYVVLADHV